MVPLAPFGFYHMRVGGPIVGIFYLALVFIFLIFLYHWARVTSVQAAKNVLSARLASFRRSKARVVLHVPVANMRPKAVQGP